MEDNQITQLSNLLDVEIGKQICVYARIHSTRQANKSLVFIILRDGYHTLQCVCLKKNIESQQFCDIANLSNETIVVLTGKLSQLPDDQPIIKYCYYQNFEFIVNNIQIVSKAEQIPFNIDDANVPYNDDSDRCKVKLSTRLDNRYVDIRTPFNNALFKCKSGLTNGFARHLANNGFTQIQTPKLLGTSSESGSSVFKLNYFNKPAYLAQSPQLYKQMLINADMKRVFEIGPVFRSENSVSNRHLCEFTGLDLEMEISPSFDYLEVVENIWNTILNMFKYVEENNKKEIDYIKSVHEYEDAVCPTEPVILNFRQASDLLLEEGYTQNINEDLTTENEKKLGMIVKNKYGSDLFALIEYPTATRPFYSKKLESNNDFTKSYDFIFRGTEICSGAQRENDYDTLLNNISQLGLSTEPFNDYLNSFKYGSYPHGGGGIGLERVVSLYFDLGNVKNTSIFPRDPSRITP